LRGNQTPKKKDPNGNSTTLESPVGVRKGTALFYKMKLDQSMERIKDFENTIPTQDEIPDLLSYKKIKPKPTTTQHQ